MKILILEDNVEKHDKITREVLSYNCTIIIDSVDNYADFIRVINTNKYDLILIDLVIPQFSDRKDDKKDMSDYII